MISIGFSNSVQLVVLLILCVHVALAKKGPTECEKRAHTSFTAQQREQLCSGASPGSIGPAVCASAAKDSLHLKFDEILVLCAGAINAAPAQCMNSLDQANRKKHGFQLCEKAYSPLSAECFKELTAFKGKRLKLESVVDFCSSLEDRAPLSCMMAVASTTLLPIDQAIFPCSNAVGNGFTDSLSHEGNNNATAACIYDMKALLTSSMGISGLDALKFCVELTPHINQQSLRTIDQPELKYDALALQSAGVQSESVACLWYAMNAQQLKKDMSATSYYNSKQKLNLCKNAQSVLGPINCTNSALHRLSPADRPHADELATLCSGAIGIGPSNCFSESRGLGSIQDRIHLCNGAVSSVRSFKLYF